MLEGIKLSLIGVWPLMYCADKNIHALFDLKHQKPTTHPHRTKLCRANHRRGNPFAQHMRLC